MHTTQVVQFLSHMVLCTGYCIASYYTQLNPGILAIQGIYLTCSNAIYTFFQAQSGTKRNINKIDLIPFIALPLLLINYTTLRTIHILLIIIFPFLQIGISKLFNIPSPTHTTSPIPAMFSSRTFPTRSITSTQMLSFLEQLASKHHTPDLPVQMISSTKTSLMHCDRDVESNRTLATTIMNSNTMHLPLDTILISPPLILQDTGDYHFGRLVAPLINQIVKGKQQNLHASIFLIPCLIQDYWYMFCIDLKTHKIYLYNHNSNHNYTAQYILDQVAQTLASKLFNLVFFILDMHYLHDPFIQNLATCYNNQHIHSFFFQNLPNTDTIPSCLSAEILNVEPDKSKNAIEDEAAISQETAVKIANLIDKYGSQEHITRISKKIQPAISILLIHQTHLLCNNMRHLRFQDSSTKTGYNYLIFATQHVDSPGFPLSSSGHALWILYIIEHTLIDTKNNKPIPTNNIYTVGQTDATLNKWWREAKLFNP